MLWQSRRGSDQNGEREERKRKRGEKREKNGGGTLSALYTAKCPSDLTHHFILATNSFCLRLKARSDKLQQTDAFKLCSRFALKGLKRVLNMSCLPLDPLKHMCSSGSAFLIEDR